MKKTFFALFCISLGIISCKKSSPDPVSPIAAKPYTNTNNGTNWTYGVKTQDPVLLDTTSVIDTVTVTGGDTTVAAGTSDERVYRILNHTATGHSYLNISGNDYYQFQEVANLGAQIQALYLKDNVDVNTSWSQDESVTVTGFPFPVTIHISSSITEKGTSRTINNITYNDVIAVKTDLTVPGLTIVSNIKNYYARDIGLIEGDYDIDVTGVTSLHSQTLIQSADPH